MKTAPIPANETERLAALHRYDVLGSPADRTFDDLTWLAAHICQTPIALISLVDLDRQCFAARIGLDVTHTSREVSFCAHAVAQSELLVVPDALADARFADNPLVSGDPNIRFYAGAPLITPDGHALGTICAIDRVPRNLTPEQTDALRALSRLVVSRMEQRLVLVEKNRQEIALRDAATFQRAILNGADYSIIATTADGVITMFNAAAERMLGYSAEEVVGKITPERIHDRSEVEQRAKELSAELGREIPPGFEVFVAKARLGTPQEHEWTYIRKDGSRFPALLSITALQDEEGQVIGFLGVARDITEQKRTGESLRESEARKSAILEAALDCIITMDEHGRIVEFNPAAETTFGYHTADVVGHELGEKIVPAHLREAHRRGMARFLATNESRVQGRRIEVTAMRADGSEFPAELAINNIRLGERRLFTAFLRDITERRQKEELMHQAKVATDAANAELARASRLKDEFLANMSHELRTPLNAVLGMSEALQEKIFGPVNEKQMKSLHVIHESGAHLLSLINDILDLSKIEAGRMDLQREPVCVDSVCHASLRLLKEAAHRKHLNPEFNKADAVRFVFGDERRIKQILVNLLSNAVKFTPSGGTVGLDVALAADGEVVEFTIRDTGIGIAEADLAKLFKPFVQLDSGLARQHEGTGLGLALVWKLAELHGGSVRVKSQPSHGSRFIVSLPAHDGAESLPETELVAPGRVTAEPSANAGETHPTVLLAEDNDANVVTFTTYLEGRGYRVTHARNGLEAVAHAKSFRPDIILMDVQMPVMDGLEATRRIRADAELKHTPIIALTALAMPGDRDRCLAAGADDYFAKPVNMKALVQKIQEHLQRLR